MCMVLGGLEGAVTHVGQSILRMIKCLRCFPHMVKFLRLDLIFSRTNPFILLQHNASLRQLQLLFGYRHLPMFTATTPQLPSEHALVSSHFNFLTACFFLFYIFRSTEAGKN